MKCFVFKTNIKSPDGFFNPLQRLDWDLNNTNEDVNIDFIGDIKVKDLSGGLGLYDNRYKSNPTYVNTIEAHTESVDGVEKKVLNLGIKAHANKGTICIYGDLESMEKVDMIEHYDTVPSVNITELYESAPNLTYVRMQNNHVSGNIEVTNELNSKVPLELMLGSNNSGSTVSGNINNCKAIFKSFGVTGQKLVTGDLINVISADTSALSWMNTDLAERIEALCEKRIKLNQKGLLYLDCGTNSTLNGKKTRAINCYFNLGNGALIKGSTKIAQYDISNDTWTYPDVNGVYQ